MSIIDVEVIVTAPEAAADGVAEFWVGGEQFGRTLLRDKRTVLEIDPRRDGRAWEVDVVRLHAALADSRDKLSTTG